jgi:mono/diheme cytochrome c family protein
MTSKLNLTMIIVVLTSAMFSCEHDVPEPSSGLQPNGQDPITYTDSCNPDTVYFEQDVLPLLNSNCAFSGCHDQGTAKEGVILTTYEHILTSDVIRPYRPDNSDLYEFITETDPDKAMPPPPFDALSADQIAIIRKWISQGAKNLSCIAGCNKTNVSYTNVISKIIETRCKGCHSGNAPGGGILLTNYSQVNAIATDNRLLGVVRQLKGYKAMPLGGQKLPSCQIDQISIWVKNGSKND